MYRRCGSVQPLKEALITRPSHSRIMRHEPRPLTELRWKWIYKEPAGCWMELRHKPACHLQWHCLDKVHITCLLANSHRQQTHHHHQTSICIHICIRRQAIPHGSKASLLATRRSRSTCLLHTCNNVTSCSIQAWTTCTSRSATCSGTHAPASMGCAGRAILPAAPGATLLVGLTHGTVALPVQHSMSHQHQHQHQHHPTISAHTNATVACA